MRSHARDSRTYRPYERSTINATRRYREDREIPIVLYHFDGSVYRPAIRTFEIPRPQRAHGVNALDEVPDSTWFTNRIGVRDLTLDELRSGPNVDRQPERPPAVDDRQHEDRRHVARLHHRGRARREVPAQVRPRRLSRDRDRGARDRRPAALGARLQRPRGLHRVRSSRRTSCSRPTRRSRTARPQDPLDASELDASARDGRASRPTAGSACWRRASSTARPLGGHPGEGTRADDPNDLDPARAAPRPARRSTRSSRGSTTPTSRRTTRSTSGSATRRTRTGTTSKHYLIDFGKALGVLALVAHDTAPRPSRTASTSPAMLGVARHARVLRSARGRRRSRPELRGVGMYRRRALRPGAVEAEHAGYLPFADADRFDSVLGREDRRCGSRASSSARSSSAAQLTDPRARAYLIDTLVARQRKTARYWFARVSPLDSFEVDDRDERRASTTSRCRISWRRASTRLPRAELRPPRARCGLSVYQSTMRERAHSARTRGRSPTMPTATRWSRSRPAAWNAGSPSTSTSRAIRRPTPCASSASGATSRTGRRTKAGGRRPGEPVRYHQPGGERKTQVITASAEQPAAGKLNAHQLRSSS